MCGITGVFNYKSKSPVDRHVLKKMCDVIKHRGPDEEGSYFDDSLGIALGHRRLSIIDLKSGQQPMTDDEGRVWIVFNGEIYNFPELRKDLLNKGYKFHTHSDTEVIINFYKEYGEKNFDKLNGIFSFAIYDKQQQCLILARDHFGVKPLYYTKQNGKFIFSSEIKSILSEPSVLKEIDLEALDTFLTFRYNPSPQTLFKNIYKIQPGYYLKINAKGTEILETYWNYIPKTNLEISEAEAIKEYQFLLENAVKRQMLSDVPVGLLLSGGIDSAAIGYLMKNFSNGKIQTFTIGFEGNGEYNEIKDARDTAKLIGSDHFEMVISQKEYIDFFYNSFYYTEEPIAYTTIPALFYVSKLSAKHVKVVLAGQGADEPLAGYKRYFGEKYISKYNSIMRLLPFKTISQLLPRNERFKRAVYASQFKKQDEVFLAIHTIFTPEQKKSLLKNHIDHSAINPDLKILQHFYEKTNALDNSLSKLLFIDTRMSLSDNLLLFGDKMAMANSLEMRVPFLDVELIRFLESIPSKYKLKFGSHKYLHKKALEKWLPKEIIKRTKRGFTTPMDKWLQKDLADTARDLFSENCSAVKQYFDINYINKLIDLHKSRKENYERHIYTLLSFELWHRQFFGI